MTFDFYSDPSHGWLKVPIAVVREHLGVRWRSEFTPFSYERGEYVYLEEDCDLGKFVRHMKFIGQPVKIRQRPQSEKRSRIRSYSVLAPI